MQATPRRKSDELGDRLSLLHSAVSSGHVLNEIAWASVRNELMKLYDLGVERARTAVMLAAAHSYRCDIAEVERFAKIASRFVPATAHEYRELISAAVRVGLFDLADEIEDLSKRQDIDVGNSYRISMAVQRGRLSEALALSKARPHGLAPDEVSNVAELEMAVAYLMEEGVSDEEVSDRVKIAHACFVGEARASVLNCVVETTPVGLLFGFPFAGTLEEGERIDVAMASAIVDQFEDTLGRHLSFLTYPFGAVVPRPRPHAWEPDERGSLQLC